jgi:AraC-like DNA-binding protein
LSAYVTRLSKHDIAGHAAAADRTSAGPGAHSDGYRAASTLRVFASARARQRFAKLAIEAIAPLEVSLSRPAPRQDHAWREAFGEARLRYLQPIASVTYSREAWLLPLRSAVPLLAERLDAELQPLTAQTAIVRVTRGAIRELLERGASQTLVAERLGLSPRTLQRALSVSGITFRELQAEVRTAEAVRLLRDPRLRIQDIAERVGFDELASFSRAFSAWTGLSASAYRAELQRRCSVSTSCALNRKTR